MNTLKVMAQPSRLVNELIISKKLSNTFGTGGEESTLFICGISRLPKREMNV